MSSYRIHVLKDVAGGDAELDVRIDSLVRALVLSRTPFDPYSSIDGPLFASVHFIGETPLWEKIGAPLLGVVARRNVKG